MQINKINRINDITQMMLAVDRNNGSISHLMNISDSPIITVIQFVVEQCNEYGIPIYILQLSQQI